MIERTDEEDIELNLKWLKKIQLDQECLKMIMMIQVYCDPNGIIMIME